GAGVTQLDGLPRRTQAMQADTLYQQGAVGIADGYTHGLERAARGHTVLAGQKSGHAAAAFANGGQHDRAMGNRLVSRYCAAPCQGSARCDIEIVHYFSPVSVVAPVKRSRACLARSKQSMTVSLSPLCSASRSTPSLSIYCVSAGTIASRLANMILRHSSGSLEAMRVKSANPPAAYANISDRSDMSASVSTRAKATTCGKWLVAARTSS